MGKKVAEGEDRLLKVAEAAALLGMQVSTLYQWVYEERIPVVKLFDRAVRFRMSTLQRLMAEQERPAKPQPEKPPKVKRTRRRRQSVVLPEPAAPPLSPGVMDLHGTDE